MALHENFGLLILFLLLGSISITAQEKPNIILFLVDDLGYYDWSGNGSSLYETPHIDVLAAGGMQFTNAYVAHPRCLPSRYALQTGRFPARAGIPGGKGQMQPGEVTVGEALQQGGYTTFFAGKWHLGKQAEQWPQQQGYDYNVGGCSAGAPISYFFPYNENRGKGGGEQREIVGLDDGVAGEYITDRLTEETNSFIRAHRDGPFFVTLAHYAVHTPFQAKAELVEKYSRKLNGQSFDGPDYMQKDGTTKMHQDNAVYAAMIESMDESLGRIVQTLKEEGLTGNTIIIFTSDHGGLSNRGADSKRALATSNLPLRAGKGHVYEGGIKVPFMVYWPGHAAAGSTNPQLTVNTDIFPTLLAMAGLPLQPQTHLDGQSLLPALDGEKTEGRTLFWHSPRGRPNSTGDHNCSAIRQGDWKLIDYYEESRQELYDLKTDPFEEHNLINEQQETAVRLQKQLDQWKKEIKAMH